MNAQIKKKSIISDSLLGLICVRNSLQNQNKSKKMITYFFVEWEIKFQRMLLSLYLHSSNIYILSICIKIFHNKFLANATISMFQDAYNMFLCLIKKSGMLKRGFMLWDYTTTPWREYVPWST